MRARSLVALAMVAGCGGARARAPVEVVEDPPATAPACIEPAWFGPAPLEVIDEQVSVDLPVTPSFEVPPRHADGSHTVRALRVSGTAHLGEELAVRGHIVWVYDCVTELRDAEAGLTAAAARKRIAADPTLCLTPRFYLADEVGDGADRSIKVVEVPRHPTRAEKKLLPKEELADPAIWRPVPPLAVGDVVTLTGTWTQRGPRGDSDMDGLLVYGSLTNVTQGWPAP